MPSIFNEEDLYDMGYEPIDVEDEKPVLNAFRDYAEKPENLIRVSASRMAVYPVVGVSVPFPGQIMQLDAVTPMEIAMAREAFNDGGAIFLGVSTDECFVPDAGVPVTRRVCEYGTFAKVIGLDAEGAGNGATVTVLTGCAARINAQKTSSLVPKHPFEAYVEPVEDPECPQTGDFRDKVHAITVKMRVLLEMIDNEISRFLLRLIAECRTVECQLYFTALHVPCDRGLKYSLLTSGNLSEMADMLDRLLDDAASELRIRQQIVGKANEQISQQRRENYLRHQMQAIKGELGESYEENGDLTELQERAALKNWSENIRKHFDKELRKMERYNITMPEYSIQYSYLDMLLNLPWDTYADPDFSLSQVRDTLDEDHYGLEKVKERIVEHMAVQKLRGDMKAPILCLAGAPGVGKTSLGKSIARALGRDYHRIALGGVSDEAEIRGHRRTYVGAMSGRIMAAIAKCKEGNPVILLDEIDKIGKGLRGDPAQALLEVLDPEQNTAFHDNYVDVDYDLSKVFFIATANDLSEVSGPLLDRMEVIELSGYIIEEKIEIALRHLVPKNLVKNGFDENEITFTRDAARCIVESYTRESGVRQLEKKISGVLRKIACLKVEGKEYPREVTPEDVRRMLGKEDVFRETYEDNSYAGVVTGLAWTAAGGEILFVETSVSNGKGDKLTITGNLGNVMKESATLALEYLRSHPDKIGLTPDHFAKSDIHVHVPEGAVPKDGPSAGITMTVSIASAMTHRKVRANLAMTGEMTLRGKVLPVGGIREKILAARRAGITDIMLCCRNRKDVEEIPERYLDGLTFHYVEHVDEVLRFALLPEMAER